MAVEQSVARDYLDRGLYCLGQQEQPFRRRQDYFEGKQDLPYAPPGVNKEYEALQQMSLANYLDIAMTAPVQPMQADGFRTGRKEKADITAWNEIWQPNHLDSRQSIVYRQMFIHGRGIMSVSANRANRKSPKIRPENSMRVWIEPDPEDPFEPLFAVKTLIVKEQTYSGNLWLPPSASATVKQNRVAYVYTADEWFRFKANGPTGSQWDFDERGVHNMGSVPFVPFDFNVDADGMPQPSIDKMMPQQDAINTIRFNTLLAMQFSAFRQRVFTGFDPVVRDEKGNPVPKRDASGEIMMDANGYPEPIVRSPGRIGVDRALVFPGELTKVFDLPESNLDNYIKVLQQYLTDFFAIGQIPPQYALTKMANITGDGMSGAESTFQRLQQDLRRAAGESLERVMGLSNIARGEAHADVASEVIWADTEIRSFAQVVDAIGKLIAGGMARSDAWAMLPGASPPKVKEWVDNSDEERSVQDLEMNELMAKVPTSDTAA